MPLREVMKLCYAEQKALFASECWPVSSGRIWNLGILWILLFGSVDYQLLRDNIYVCATRSCRLTTLFPPPDYDPLPHIPVVEMASDDEGSEVESVREQFPPKWVRSTLTRRGWCRTSKRVSHEVSPPCSSVVSWIKQMVPQPVILPPGAVPIERPKKSSRSSLDKGLHQYIFIWATYFHFGLHIFFVVFFAIIRRCYLLILRRVHILVLSTVMSPPPESLSGISLDTDSKASGCILIQHSCYKTTNSFERIFKRGS